LLQEKIKPTATSGGLAGSKEPKGANHTENPGPAPSEFSSVSVNSAPQLLPGEYESPQLASHRNRVLRQLQQQYGNRYVQRVLLRSRDASQVQSVSLAPASPLFAAPLAGTATPPGSAPPARAVGAVPDSSEAAPIGTGPSGPTQPAISSRAGTATSQLTSPPVTAPAGTTAGPNANEPLAEPTNATSRAGAGPGGIEPGVPTAHVVPQNAPAAPAAQFDGSSSSSILESLSSVPASGFAAALTAVKGKLPEVQSREKREARETVPMIDTPTGLPGNAAPRAGAAPAAFPLIRTQTAPVAANGKVTPPAPTPQTAGPVPSSQVPLPKGEPAAADDSGGWWSWLVDRLRSFFGSLPTSDPNLSTSAGPRQRVALNGDADPAQNAREEETAGQSVQAGRSHADSAIPADFGEDAIAPNVPPSKLRAAYRPAAPRVPAASRGVPVSAKVPANERAMFDERAAPLVADQVGQQDAGYRRQQAIYQRAVKKAQDDGARQLAEENARTRADQVALRDAAKADVGGARKRWREENRKIEAEFGDKSSAKRRDIDRQIGQKVDATHRDADAAFDEAEKKAESEKAKAEADAAAKKKEEEGKPRSWWDRVKGAVSDAFSAIRGAITAIFDKLRAVVKGIIDTAKKAVHALIEAARSAIVAMISAFGTFLKGLVTIALAAFPNAAAKARAWIDDRVKAATNAVNRAATALESAARAILDRIAQGIDAALDILQAAVLAAIDVLENVALLPLKIASALATFWEILKILRSGALEKLFDAAKDPKKLAQPIVDKVEPLASQVPVKANQLALEKSHAAPAQAGSSPGRTIVQRQSATPEKSVGEQAGELILEGRIKEGELDVPSPAPGEGFWGGVWRHLKAAGNHFLQNWKTTVINLAYSLLLFYPVLLQEGPKLWEECKGVIFGGGGVDRFDHVLGVLRHLVNIVAGLVATAGIWAFIIGAFTGPGEAIVAGAYETISLGVIGADVALGLAEMGKAWYSATREGISAKTRETYLSMFSSSAISTAIVIILVILGAIASRLAKAFKAYRAGAAEASERVKGAGEKPKETEPTESKPAQKITDNPDKLVICRVCDTVPNVPPDLMAKRAALSPEARARLDQTAAAIFKDPLNPTPEQFNSLRAFMDAMEKRGNGSLEDGLQDLIAADAKKNAPAPPPPAKPPFGPAVAKLPGLRSEIEEVINEITDFADANPDNPTITRLAKNPRNVADGPLNDMETGQLEANDYHVERVQGTIKGAKGELAAAKEAPKGTKFSEELGGREIDQIQPDGTLKQIKQWDIFEKSDPQFAKVEAQVRGTLQVAVDNPIGGKPRPVVVEFRNGVKQEVANALRAIDVNGHKATIVGTEVP